MAIEQTKPTPNQGLKRYVVYLTNPDDQRDTIHSFASGRYGFCVRAIGLEHAVDLVVERAVTDGFYGRDWMAEIVPLTTPTWDHSIGLRLRDGDRPKHVHAEYPVEVLWWPPVPASWR